MDWQLIIVMSVVFAAIATATRAALQLVGESRLSRQRVARVAAAPAAAEVPESLLRGNASRWMKRVRSFVPRSPKEMNRVERVLANAGYYGAGPATAFVIAQLVLPAVLFVLVATALRDSRLLIFAVLAAVLGYYLPLLWLGRAVDARRRQIRNGLPDASDLLIVSIESGAGIDQALSRVSEELRLAHPAVSRELDMITAETRAGKPRIEALKNFAERTKVEDARALVAMLIQTDRFGTSIGQALRTYAEASRTKRRQRAEERAAKLGVKLLFPLVFCLFPAFYIVVLGPSMIRIFRQLVFGNALN